MSPAKRILVILSLLLLINLFFKPKNCFLGIFTRNTLNHAMGSSIYKSVHKNKFGVPTTIVLGIVVFESPQQFSSREEAAVLLKSIIISAKLNKIKSIDIYFFFGNLTRETAFFKEKLKEFGYPFKDFTLDCKFISAATATPEIYRGHFSVDADPKKCTNLRLFFPSALPQVETILYLDTDMLVYGSLENLWQLWGSMDDKQLIGIAPQCWHTRENDKRMLPHPPPVVLNAGVLLMNLTRMREYGWERKIMHILFDIDILGPRSNIDDQERINVLLFYNPDLFLRLSCHLNYMGCYCNFNKCESAEVNGLQLIHGAGDKFEWPWSFRSVYLAYQSTNLSSLDFNSKEEFRIYIKKSFERFRSVSEPCEPLENLTSMCDSVLRRLL